MLDARFALQLFNLVGYKLGIAGAVAPAFDVSVGAIDALVHAPPLRLNRDRRAMTLIATEIDPSVERGRWQRIEICLLARRSEHDHPIFVAYYAGQ
jgi:hypothetical protein